MPHPILAQVSLDLTSIGKLGEVVIVSLVAIILAMVLLRVVKNTGDNDKQDKSLLKQMIDLATSYKTESAEARDAYKAEAAATRAVVQESNDTLRALTEATNIQTGEIRLLRTDFKNYQTLQSDTVSGLRADFDGLKKEVLDHVQHLLEISESNAQHHAEAEADRIEIHKKLDAILDLVKPPPPPATNVVNVNPPAPETDTELKAAS